MKTCIKSVVQKCCIWRVPHTLRSKVQVKAFPYFVVWVTKRNKTPGFYICKVKELLIHSCRMAVSRICHQLLRNSRNLGIYVSSCTCELLWMQRRGQTAGSIINTWRRGEVHNWKNQQEPQQGSSRLIFVIWIKALVTLQLHLRLSFTHAVPYLHQKILHTSCEIRVIF